MVRVIIRVANLIVLVIATFLIINGVADRIQTIPVLESRILIVTGLLLGLLLFTLLLIRLRRKPQRNRIFSQPTKSWLQGLRGTLYLDPTIQFTIIVTIVVSATMIVSAYYADFVRWVSQYGWRFGNSLPQFITADDRQFFMNFIEWFGVFYGFVVSGVLIKVWEQFANAERLFDKEADAISILYENLMLLRGRKRQVEYAKYDTIKFLRYYVSHVIENYLSEHEHDDIRLKGNYLLRRTMGGLYNLRNIETTHEGGNLHVSELNGQLNNLINLRGDRISGSKQRIYQSFRLLSISISLMWLLPFYLLTAGPASIIHQSLVTGVTFLVIFVLSVIEDLDDPFSGFWRINIGPWVSLHDELNSESKYSQEEHLPPNEESSKPKEAIVNISQPNNSTMKAPSLVSSQESSMSAELQIDVEESEDYESVVPHEQDSISRLNTNANLIGWALVSISIIVAAIIVKKRK